MQFCFREEKAAQAAALLLQLSGGRLKYIHLLKMLYLADRESLLQTGHPITGDHFVSMDHGPVLSRIYDLIKSERRVPSPWREMVRTEAYHSVLTQVEPDLGELSPFEDDLLRQVHSTYAGMDPFDLCDLLHDPKLCPEWHDPHGSMIPIAPEELLRQWGRSEEWIRAVEAEIDAEAYMDWVDKRVEAVESR